MHALLIALGALLGAAPAPAPQPARALDDATIVAIFDAANQYDIETSRLVLKRSHTKAVRDLAQQFMHDHAAVQQQGRDLAKRLGVTPTPPKQNPLAPDHEAALKALRAKSGAAFDQAYAAEEVRYHQQVLDAVSGTLLPAIRNADLKAFVEKVGPAFKGHLEAAKQLQRQLRTTTAGT
jgi:putative membrane protein